MNLLAEMARAAWQAREDRFPARVRIKFEERFIEDDAQVVLMLRAALSAALKHGWKLVPVEATPEMIHAPPDGDIVCPIDGRRYYRAMIEAAPSIEGDG